MKTLRFTAALVATLAYTLAFAAEIKVISSIGMKAVLEELKPQFERASPHTLAITLGTAAPLKRQIEGGEAFDVAILTPPMIEDLAKLGKVAPATVANVAKSGIGVAVGKGKGKPDIGTADAFKRTLLDSKSIAYTKEGQSGSSAALPVLKSAARDAAASQAFVDFLRSSAALPVLKSKGMEGS